MLNLSLGRGCNRSLTSVSSVGPRDNSRSLVSLPNRPILPPVGVVSESSSSSGRSRRKGLVPECIPPKAHKMVVVRLKLPQDEYGSSTTITNHMMVT